MRGVTTKLNTILVAVAGLDALVLLSALAFLH